MDYFIIWFKLDYHNQYAIWCTGQKSNLPDQFYQENGLIPIFENITSLNKYATRKNITLIEEKPTIHNLDCVQTWLKTTSKKKYHKELLNAWNFFGDIAAIEQSSYLHFEKLTQNHLSRYEKLFYAGNILRRDSGNINPKYCEKLTKQDILSISIVLRYGFKLLRKSFRYHKAQTLGHI